MFVTISGTDSCVDKTYTLLEHENGRRCEWKVCGGLMESKPQGEQPSGWMSTLKKRHGHMARAPINGEIARRHIELWSKKSMSANVRKGDFQTNLRLAPGSMYIINTPNTPLGVSNRVLCIFYRQNVETNLRHPFLNPKCFHQFPPPVLHFRGMQWGWTLS